MENLINKFTKKLICFYSLFKVRGLETSPVATEELWWAYPTETKLQTPPNWNIKHYKLVEFLSNLNVKPPPRTNLKPPNDDFLVTVLLETKDKYFKHWEPAYDIFVLRFRPKNSSFRLPYHRPSPSADCARELFKGSNGSASLVDCIRKKVFGWGVQIFCDWRHKWSSFRVILAHVAWPRAQPLG